eukprot:CAMPEP_0119135526 /NCGR_PEP_ID=MMETSP1310-20130426/19460_1 /TAXON_ID=464262 /ORGANISM="Genus nov. species nov., Strain RCC2339" /LENGTH=660 /DNA_ID=CAMNT_0007126419 /DNA_START=1 /DNA_END=1983 /DNA_ORIENTATION=+
MSPVVGEIMMGMVLGPNLADFVPLAELGGTDCEGRRRLLGSEGTGTSLWVVLGQLGVTLLIAESGMHLDFDTLKKVGSNSFCVASLGTTLPLGLGVLFVWILGYNAYPDGLSAGCALAPTSVGIALKLLSETRQLNSSLGQTVVASAFVDDVMSLVALGILMDLAKGDVSGWGVARPVVLSLTFLVATGLLGYFVFPRVVPWCLSKVPLARTSTVNVSLTGRDELLTLFFVGTVLVYSYVGSLVGSHLLGSFMAGVSFCRIPRTMQVWHHQAKRLETWLVRLFFAATVGFSIPIDRMIAWDAFWKGMVLAAVPCCLGKLLSGFWMKRIRWIVGSAMLGRGEFAYLVAETAKTTINASTGESMLSEDAYAAVVWALLVATIVAPFLFKYLLVSHSKVTRRKSEIAGTHRTLEAEDMYWRVTLIKKAEDESTYNPTFNASAQQHLLQALLKAGMDVRSVEVSSDDEHDYEAYIIVPLDMNSLEKLFQNDPTIIEGKIVAAVNAVVEYKEGHVKFEVQCFTSQPDASADTMTLDHAVSNGGKETSITPSPSHHALATLDHIQHGEGLQRTPSGPALALSNVSFAEDPEGLSEALRQMCDASHHIHPHHDGEEKAARGGGKPTRMAQEAALGGEKGTCADEVVLDEAKGSSGEEGGEQEPKQPA